MTDLSSRRALREAATPGPWRVRHEAGVETTPHDVYSYSVGRFRDGWRRVTSCDGSIQGKEDAALIAQMHADYPVLLEIAEAAQSIVRSGWSYDEKAMGMQLSERQPPEFRRLSAALARLPELEERT